MRRYYRRRRARMSWKWVFTGALLIMLAFILYNKLGDVWLYPWSLGRNVELIDADQEPVLAGAPGWEYNRTLQADLDNDGDSETIEILAKVMLDPTRPQEYQWDDGQPWQVYIRDGQEVTHVYSRFVQLGQLYVFTTDEKPSRLAIAESQGAGYALYLIKYSGPGKTHVARLASLSVANRAW